MKRFLSATILLLVSCINITQQTILPKNAENQTIFYRTFIEQFADQVLNRVKLQNAFANVQNDTCTQTTLELLTTNVDMDTLKFFDAWGKIPSGVLYGHLLDLGNFDECLAASKSSVDKKIKGKYFLLQATIANNETHFGTQSKMATLFDASTELISYTFGTCFPDSCSSDVVRNIFQTEINSTTKLLALFGVDLINSSAIANIPIQYNVRSSSVQNRSFDSVALLAICIFTILGSLMIISSCYEYCATYKHGQPNLLLISFSVLTNGRKLFHIDTTRRHTSIECLNGIRILSMIWVIFGHTHNWGAFFPFSNTVAIEDWIRSPYSMLIQTATVSVDTFLLMSGILTSWVALYKMDENKGHLNIPLMYLHRYIRLTPTLAAAILFVVGIVPYMGDGPFWKDFTYQVTKNCETNWWITLLYINNYLRPVDLCLGHSWYLSVDTQLFLISPFVLLGLWRWRSKFIWILILFACLSYGCAIATMITSQFTGLLMGGLLSTDQIVWSYYPTHKRMAPWIIGVIFGYYLYNHRNKHLRLSPLVIALGWLTAISTMAAVIFGPYHLAKNGIEPSIMEAALYEAFGRSAWALGLSWIIFTCQMGYSQTLNSILSYAGWQPIARMTYVIYIVTVIIQGINAGIIQTDKHFSSYEIIQTFWAELGISLCVSIIVVLALESPVIAIEKYILSRKKPNI